MTKQLRINRHDQDIFTILAEQGHVTKDVIHLRTGRHVRSADNALRRLYRHGVLARTPWWDGDKFKGFVYSPKGKAVKLAEERDLPKNLRVTPEKSPLLTDHEMGLTLLLEALIAKANQARFGPPFIERRPAALKFSFEHDGEKMGTNADALIGLPKKDTGTGKFYDIEYERTRQHSYEDGISNRMRKAKAFHIYRTEGYYETHWKKQGIEMKGIRRIWIMPSHLQAMHLLQRLSVSGLRFNMFGVTTEEQFLKDPYGEIFITAKDYNLAEPGASPRVSFATW